MQSIEEKELSKWELNQRKPLTSEGFVEVTYTINDPDAEASATGTPKHELSRTSMPGGLNPPLIDETRHTVTPLATLEQDLWLLDGTKTTVYEGITEPNEEGKFRYTGFISNYLCDEHGNFEDNPRIQIDFANTVSILPGLIITWSAAFGDYPTEFKITSHSGNQQESETVLDNTDTESMVIFEMTDIDRIEVEVIKWSNPHRRARIEQIFLGLRKTYTKKDLLGFTTSGSLDVVSASLPKYDVSFEVDNRDGDFDPLNPKGLAKYMIERQEIRTRYGFKLDDEIEWISGGVYYLSDWSAPQNGISASFRARDLLGFLNRTYHKGRFPDEEYEPDGISLYTLALEVLGEANLPQLRTNTNEELGIYPSWTLDKVALNKYRTTAPLPICSFGECLQLIANAACCVIYFDRDGILHIKQLDDTIHAAMTQDEIGKDALLRINDRNSYTRPEIELTKPVKQIDVSMHSFVSDDESSDIYEGILPLEPGINEFMVEFSDMAEDVHGEIIEVTVSDGSSRAISSVTIHPSTVIYARSCKLVLNSTLNEEVNCKIRFTGKRCRSSETIITTSNLPTGEIQPLNNVLITNVQHAQHVGRWLRDNLSRRKHISLDWRADPSINVGDIVEVGGQDEEICTDTGNILVEGRDGEEVRITSSSFTFSGAFKGKVEGVVMQS